MNISKFQQHIKYLIKEQGSSDTLSDPYFKKLEQSPELSMVREIAIWWRLYQLENFCPISSRLLKRQGQYEDLVEAYYLNHSVSPFIEQAGLAFLSFTITKFPATLIAQIAAFEKALITTRKGSDQSYETIWNVNPYEVLSAILQEETLPKPISKKQYKLTVSIAVENYFKVEIIEKQALKTKISSPKENVI